MEFDERTGLAWDRRLRTTHPVRVLLQTRLDSPSIPALPGAGNPGTSLDEDLQELLTHSTVTHATWYSARRGFQNKGLPSSRSVSDRPRQLQVSRLEAGDQAPRASREAH